MNRDRIQGQIQQSHGALRKQWGRLTRNAHEVERGERDRLSGKLRKKYGAQQDEAQAQIRELKARL